MAKYIIRFMPEYCATSLWAGNDEARAAFGSPIEYSDVHLPEELIRRLEDFDDADAREQEEERKRQLSALEEHYHLNFAGHLPQLFHAETLHKTVEYMRKHF